MSRPVVVFVGSKGWSIGVRESGERSRIADVPLADSTDGQSIATARLLKELGYQGQPLVLALPSTSCLAASISTNDLPRPRNARHQGMIYRLEEQLPLAAEDFVADFVATANAAKRVPPSHEINDHGPAASNKSATRLGIAVTTETVAAIITGLEAHGVAIGPICPESLLAFQAYVKSNPVDPNSLVVWADQERMEAFKFSLEHLAGWSVLEPKREALEEYLSLMRLQAGHPCVCAFLNCPESLGTFDTSRNVRPINDFATEAAGEILDGLYSPFVDLRRDALAAQDSFRMVRRPLRGALLSAIVLTICLAGAFLIQANRYDRTVAAVEEKQQAIYRRLYPNSTVPAGIRARLQSETVRLRAMNGQSADLPRQGSALTTLYEVLRRLPTSTRFRLLDLRMGPDDFSLEGQTKSHTDADVLAASLRRQKGFQVEPTRTEQLSTGEVAFTISGTSSSAPKSEVQETSR